MIPTLIGVLTILFFISEFVPGGPYDQIVAMIQGNDQAMTESVVASRHDEKGKMTIDSKEEQRIKRAFGLTCSRTERYFRTILYFAKDSITSTLEVDDKTAQRVNVGRTRYLAVRNDQDSTVVFDLFDNSYLLDQNNCLYYFDHEKERIAPINTYAFLEGDLASTPLGFEFADNQEGSILNLKVVDLIYHPISKTLHLADESFNLQGIGLLNPQLKVKKNEVITRYEEIMDLKINPDGSKEWVLLPRHELYIKQDWLTALTDWKNYHGYFLLKFPDSIRYGKPAYDVIMSKMPVSLRLGIISFFLVYSICIILGISKAVRDGSVFDTVTSIMILIGFSIPGFVLAVFLLKCFGPNDPLFQHLIPLSGLHTLGADYDMMTNSEKFFDNLHHLIAPIICYTIGSFAMFTMLTKNSILEHTTKLYAVAARARGLSERKVLFKHILRNSLIPLITGFPTAFLMMFFGGSLLIEKIFNLDGVGKLGFDALTSSDFPLLISNLFMFTFIGLLGRLVTDIAYVIVDPRISFEGSRS